MDEAEPIQDSFHTLVDSPSPIAFPRWLKIKSLPLRIPLQPWEQDVAASTLRKEEDVQYLPVNTLDRRQSGFVMSLHAIFPKRARLKA